MSDVFITYAREDYEKARSIAGHLESAGWSVWWDRRIPPGKSFDQVIEEALDSTRCVVVLWSRASISSDWVRAEAAEGKARNILVPALLEDVRIPLEFRRLQAARLTQWKQPMPGPDLDRFLSSISQILRKPIRLREAIGNSEGSFPPPQGKPSIQPGGVARRLSLPRVVLGAVSVLAILSAIFFFPRPLGQRGTAPPPTSSPLPIAAQEEMGRDSSTSPVQQGDLSALSQYKIDVYFDQECALDKNAADRVQALLSRETPDVTVVLAPRRLDFLQPIVPPTTYEVRYDPPSEREAARALVDLLNRHESSWKVVAVPSWSQTRGVLSILLFSRADSDLEDERP